ncbi:MAG TPA: PA14 domain-containing protein [Rariglobus sp.]|nr:PA14 domain-containing protein [Rariglobus sp.]
MISASAFTRLCLIAVLAAGPTLHAQPETAFGVHERKAASLIGIFYDLKQTQQRKPIPDAPKYYESTIDDFVLAGFDEALLNRFFRAALPLYTSQIAIPDMSADAAPKAFGVESVVKPSNWIVHYKAQIAPPADGTYRFVGNVDDLLVVAINGKVVLVGNWPNTHLKKLNWKSNSIPGPVVAANTYSKYGDWIDLKAGVPVDIDIILGERPGGKFQGIILYEKQGDIYPPNAAGQAVLPLFQTAGKSMGDVRFLTDRPHWKCFE